MIKLAITLSLLLVGCQSAQSPTITPSRWDSLSPNRNQADFLKERYLCIKESASREDNSRAYYSRGYGGYKHSARQVYSFGIFTACMNAYGWIKTPHGAYWAENQLLFD